VASNDEASANRALQIIRDLTASAEVGKTYLGKVTRLADFGAFVEIIPGTEGLLHISEVAEHRIKDVRDELKEGDQVLVKVLAVEGNRIRLSRKAILKEQRAKMGGAPLPEDGDGGDSGEGREPRGQREPREPREPREQRPQAEFVAVSAPVGEAGLTLEGGAEFDEGDEPNFNRVESPSQPTSQPPRPDGDRGGRGGRPGGGGGRGRRPRRDGGRGGFSGGGRSGGGGGGRH